MISSNYFADETAVMLLWAKAISDTNTTDGQAAADELHHQLQPLMQKLRAHRGTPDARIVLAKIVAAIRDLKGERYYQRVIGSTDRIIRGLPDLENA